MAVVVDAVGHRRSMAGVSAGRRPVSRLRSITGRLSASGDAVMVAGNSAAGDVRSLPRTTDAKTGVACTAALGGNDATSAPDR